MQPRQPASGSCPKPGPSAGRVQFPDGTRALLPRTKAWSSAARCSWRNASRSRRAIASAYSRVKTSATRALCDTTGPSAVAPVRGV